MDANFRYCAELVREADHDRYLATLFAPAGKRPALFALYAFNVEIARVRDAAREALPGEIRLQWWREAILGERAAEVSANPVAAAFDATLGRFDLAREQAAALIDAHRFDVYDEPMQSIEALAGYARDTAGMVVSLAANILQGSSFSNELVGEAAHAHTVALVLAQLPRHSARQQLYVPADILRRHGANSADFYAMEASPSVRAALAEMREGAQRNLARVAQMSEVISEAAGPALLPLAPLPPWLRSLEGAGYDPFHPPEVPRWRRQWQIWRASKSLRRLGGG
ncbi:MAG TPA: phytoene/squalene synthase family protein [Pseudolabrys sp.]|nr:phytoene/squalene synthase family protein [Pseudolabrys sp.]